MSKIKNIKIKGARPRKIFQHLRFISQKEVLQTADQISPVTIKIKETCTLKNTKEKLCKNAKEQQCKID